jgi:class 3 adenylate cyclase
MKQSQVQDGLLFIPDISGFTNLVHSTDVLTGQQITEELLSTIIGHNQLGLSIAEVEGDAILFYRYGAAPGMNELEQQYEKMVVAFETKLKELQLRFERNIELSLKVIVHYGPMVSYNIGPFKKLYGEVVVEAHRLLKNSIVSGSYLLVTDALLGKIEVDDRLNGFGSRSNKLCEVYGSMRNICFMYLDYGEVA